MRGAEFAELAAFAAIADHGSFLRAAGALGVSTSGARPRPRANCAVSPRLSELPKN
jgi:hypothetical protein